MKKYKVILIDCPWKYKDKCESGERGAEFKYPVLSIYDLMDLNIQKIAAKDCALFAWITGPLLIPYGQWLLNAWGFEYKTIAFTWVKVNKVSDTLFMGMGNYTRANPEFCILGIKGKPIRRSASVHSIIPARLKGHSKKPDEQYNRIESLYGDVSRVELFANKTRKGWDSLGFGVGSSDIRTIL